MAGVADSVLLIGHGEEGKNARNVAFVELEREKKVVPVGTDDDVSHGVASCHVVHGFENAVWSVVVKRVEERKERVVWADFEIS